MIDRIDLSFDVSSVIPEQGSYQQAGWLFVPPRPLTEPLRLIVAVPGGGYTKAYYHMDIVGYPEYSCAEHLTKAGYFVLALDHIGVGESTRLRDGDLIDLNLMAACIDHVVRQMRVDIEQGDLAPSVPPTNHYSIIGVGHSVGAATMVTGQAMFESFDAIGVVGTTNLWPKYIQTPPGEAGPSPDLLRDQTIANLKKLIGDKWDDVYFKVDRSKVRSWFYMDDVPEDVVAADGRAATVTARMVAVDAQTPGKRAALAAQIAVPVLFALGEIDVSPDPPAELPVFSGSSRVDYFELPNSAHCHNFASTRHLLWNRIDAWARSIEPVATVRR